MADLNFPTSPVDGQTYGEYTYVASKNVWQSIPGLPAGVPAGTIMAWGGSTAPDQWLICDGSTISRSTYSSLFAAIGTTYGAGDGSTTFKLPDLRGRVPVGKNTGTFATLGATGGAETHTLTIAEMPSHTHPYVGPTPNTDTTAYVTDTNVYLGTGRWPNTTSATGGGGAHNNLQPYQVVNYIIKYAAAYVPQESELVPRINNLEIGGRNYLINADFAINQRGFTSTTGHGVYGLDRWQQGVSGGTSTYSTQAFAVGSAPVSGYEAINYARIVVSGQSAAGDFSYLQQQIENVRILSGQTATVSFWARSGSGTPKIAVAFEQMFGSGGSPSASVTTYAGQVVLSTSWTRYSVTVNIPSISGKTLGTTANTSALKLQLWTSAGTTYNTNTGSLGVQANTFDFWGVQVESGSYATPFKINSSNIQTELLMCQRYYITGTMGGDYYMGSNNSVGNGAHNHSFVPMRVAPTATVLSFTNTDNAVNNGILVLGNGRVNGNFRNNNTGFPYYNFTATFKLEAEL